LTITEDRKDNFLFMRAVHPGEVLKQELKEVGVAPTEFARQIDVPPNRVSQIIAGKRSVTGDTALRLGHWFGTDPQFWLNLQSAFDLRVAQQEVGGEIARLPVRAGASA
jgi:addiction module HigA family antidote